MLNESGFDFDKLDFGRRGMKVEDKPQRTRDIKSVYPKGDTTALKKSSEVTKRNVMHEMSIIYETQRDLRKKI